MMKMMNSNGRKMTVTVDKARARKIYFLRFFPLFCPVPLQGCQMVYFLNKNPTLGKFWRALEWKNVCRVYDHLEYFKAFWYNLWPFGIVFGELVHFSHFGKFGP
jgi:hypothetical protein